MIKIRLGNEMGRLTLKYVCIFVSNNPRVTYLHYPCDMVKPRHLLEGCLDYNEEVHWLVKNFNPRQGYLGQPLVRWTRWKNNTKKESLKLEFSRGQVSCVRV
jgi:hypothetical protein